MKKLTIYGDSILKGVTFSTERGRHTLSPTYKLEGLTRLGVEVKNLSKMGATITYGLDIIDRTLAECGENTVALLEYGGNDCDYNWGEISQNPSGSFLPNTPEEAFIEKYNSAIRRIRSTGASPVLSTLVPVDAERYMRWISKNNSYENIMSWLGDTSMLYRWQERYNRIVERIARENDIPLLDLRESFLSSHSYKTLICDDGIHPSDKGHALIEEELCKMVSNDARFSA